MTCLNRTFSYSGQFSYHSLSSVRLSTDDVTLHLKNIFSSVSTESFRIVLAFK